MARRNKFALQMKNKDGEVVFVRDLKALKENFDPTSVLENFKDGKLLAWLQGRYCDKEAEAVEALKEMPQEDVELLQCLCEIFGQEPLSSEECQKLLVPKESQEETGETEEKALDPEQQVEQWIREAEEAADANAWNTAVKLYEMAADAGNVEAISELGSYYYLGEGVEKDDTKAYELWKKAAAQNDGDACFGLGVLYKNGEAVSKDLEEAEKWFQKAMESGDTSCAINSLDWMGDIKLEQGNWDAAMSWYEKFVQQLEANHESLQDQASVAWLAADYLSGKQPKNEQRGQELLQAYSDGDQKKSRAALREIADSLMNSYDESDHWEQTLPWYRIAAEADDGDACWALGLAYQQGYGGLSKDGRQAFKLFKKGANAGSPFAMNWLAGCYSAGNGVAENLEQAIKWQKNAVAACRKLDGEMPSFMVANLGFYYMNRNVGTDWQNAEKYLREAANLGDEDAEQILEEQFSAVVPIADDMKTDLVATEAALEDAFQQGFGTSKDFIDRVIEEMGGSRLKNAASGAAGGAVVASILPGFGTILGGAIGAAAGALMGGLSDDEKASIRSYARDWYSALQKGFVDFAREHALDSEISEGLASYLKDSMHEDYIKEQVTSRQGVQSAWPFVRDTLSPLMEQ